MNVADPVARSRSTGAARPEGAPAEQTLATPVKIGPAVAQDNAIATSKVEGETAEIPEAKPPFTPLDFKIPGMMFRESKLAEPGSPESFWSYSLYRGPQGDAETEPKVKVHYCKSRHTTERVLQQYFMNEKVLGFDLEWQPEATKYHGPRKNVSSRAARLQQPHCVVPPLLVS